MTPQTSKILALRRAIALGLKQLDAAKAKQLDRKTLEGIKTRGRAKLAASSRKKNVPCTCCT
jgi:hypothetical protein